VRFDRLAKESDLVRAKLELSRIHPARSALLAAFLDDLHPKLAKRLRGLDRYERKVFAKQRRLLRGRAKPVSGLQDAPTVTGLVHDGDWFLGGPAAAQSGHVDSMQPCRSLTRANIQRIIPTSGRKGYPTMDRLRLTWYTVDI